jgi:hypothetical protein
MWMRVGVVHAPHILACAELGVVLDLPQGGGTCVGLGWSLSLSLPLPLIPSGRMKREGFRIFTLITDAAHVRGPQKKLMQAGRPGQTILAGAKWRGRQGASPAPSERPRRP